MSSGFNLNKAITVGFVAAVGTVYLQSMLVEDLRTSRVPKTWRAPIVQVLLVVGALFAVDRLNL